MFKSVFEAGFTLAALGGFAIAASTYYIHRARIRRCNPEHPSLSQQLQAIKPQRPEPDAERDATKLLH